MAFDQGDHKTAGRGPASSALLDRSALGEVGDRPRVSRVMRSENPDLPGPLQALSDEFDVTGTRLERLHRFWCHYEGLGLIRDGVPVYLHTAPTHRECWEGREPPDENEQHYGIHLPWIGESYEESKILVIGINPRGWDAFGTSMQWGVHRAVGEYFAGARPAFSMQFHKASAACAAAILASLSGEEPRADPDLPTLGAAHQRTALLEAIKCTSTTSPTPQMWGNCPYQTKLHEEIELINPSVLLVVGEPQRDYLKEVFPGNWHHGPYQRFTTQIKARDVEAICVYHPARARYKKGGFRGTSLAALVEDLAERPLAGAG